MTAINAFDKTIEIDSQYVPAWSNKALALNNIGKYDEAIRACDKAIEIDPQDALAWFEKGFSLNNLGKYDKAILALDKAIELDPKFAAEAWNNNCLLYTSPSPRD